MISSWALATTVELVLPLVTSKPCRTAAPTVTFLGCKDSHASPLLETIATYYHRLWDAGHMLWLSLQGSPWAGSCPPGQPHLALLPILNFPLSLHTP